MTAPPKDLSSSSDGENQVTEPSTDNETKADSYDTKNHDESLGNKARTTIGRGMHEFTALINDNIIAARYGVFATIGMLTVSHCNLCRSIQR